MPNRNTDSLFLLIQSLEKSEKRNFKLFVNRNAGSAPLKTVVLFDALDKANEYNEELILKKHPEIKKEQLSNLKAALYHQLLDSLRVMNTQANIDIEMHQQLDFARILYQKGLYIQALHILDKLKKLAKANFQMSYWNQILFFEKKIESLHITRSIENTADLLIADTIEAVNANTTIHQLSNAALKMYSWYLKNGLVKNAKEAAIVKELFQAMVPKNIVVSKNFFEQLYYYQSICWYAFVQQDFLKYYKYTNKWVHLFEQTTHMKQIEPMHYIKGMHNYVTALFDLKKYDAYEEVLQNFEAFLNNEKQPHSLHTKIHGATYYYLAKINYQFLKGDFTNGLPIVVAIENHLNHYEPYLDRYRVLIFYYKIACLYFGSGHNGKAIDYLQKIIQLKVDLRSDLQCYARLLHLIAHYELGNYDILESLVKSVYRFMANMENLSKIEMEIFNFIRNSFHLNKATIKPALQKILVVFKKYEDNIYETRTFRYLDVISWLESKLNNQPVEQVIKNKYLSQLKK
jgi:hypothetical protein